MKKAVQTPAQPASQPLLLRFMSDTHGATAMEYGLIGALLSVAIITAVSQVGNGVFRLFNKVAVAIPSSP